jgi:hypothetical protein
MPPRGLRRQRDRLPVLQFSSCTLTLTAAFGSFILGHIAEREPHWQRAFVGYVDRYVVLQILTGDHSSYITWGALGCISLSTFYQYRALILLYVYHSTSLGIFANGLALGASLGLVSPTGSWSCSWSTKGSSGGLLFLCPSRSWLQLLFIQAKHLTQ